MSAPFALRNVRVPGSVLHPVSRDVDLPRDREGLVGCDLMIADGRIAAILPPGTALGDNPGGESRTGGIVLPTFADVHTHLDKSHIWDRTPNASATFMGAIDAVTRDREAFWTPDDLAARMEFALQTAFAHGTSALRTHLDTPDPVGAASWPVFRRLQAAWDGRIALQGVALVMLERYLDDDAHAIARLVAAGPGACLGAVAMRHNTSVERLDALFALATEYGLDLDLHVDENGETNGTALEAIAERALAQGFKGRILCGHCCSLAVQERPRIAEIIARVRDAGIGIVSLPMCNLFLQDRAAGETPCWRGVTLLHELAAAGVPVMMASDNVRDPFYAYGDYDMLDVYAQGTRIAHLDAPYADWLRSVTLTPAAWMGRDAAIGVGAPADLVLHEARSLNELLARPHAGRQVMRAGAITRAAAPDPRALDAVLGRA